MKERIYRALEGLSYRELKCVWHFVHGIKGRKTGEERENEKRSGGEAARK